MIYQSAVPQGAFEITDLNTASTGGDLDVTIKEEDGSEQRFTQPYASLAILKREGQTDVDVSVGNCAMKMDLPLTSFRRRSFTAFPTESHCMGECRLLRITALLRWESVRSWRSGRNFIRRDTCSREI